MNIHIVAMSKNINESKKYLKTQYYYTNIA